MAKAKEVIDFVKEIDVLGGDNVDKIVQAAQADPDVDVNKVEFVNSDGKVVYSHSQKENDYHKTLKQALADGASLKGIDLHNKVLNGVDLSGLNLDGANLSGANLANAKLVKTSLKGADFTGANLYHADLRYADCSNANFTGAKVRDMFKDYANLDGSIFDKEVLAHHSFVNLDAWGNKV